MKSLAIIAGIAAFAVALVGLSAFLVDAAEGANDNYDADGDGLIEITYLEQLDAVRHDMDGDGVPEEGYEAPYSRAFPGASGSLCQEACVGYELARSLDFLGPDSYASGAVNPRWTTGHGWSPLGWCNVAGHYPKCGEAEHGVSGFYGATFEGNGHTIANLYVNFPNQKIRQAGARFAAGLFGETRHNGVIANVGLEDVYVIGDTNVGALVGSNSGLVTGSYATGHVIGNSDVGGLVGWNRDFSAAGDFYRYGTIEDSYTDVVVEALGDLTRRNRNSSGGLVGWNRGLVLRSYALGQVKSRITRAGGLVGTNDQEASIRFSYATGPVFRGWYHYNREGSTGGLVGLNIGEIDRSHATGAVWGDYVVGGLSGHNGGAITSSYATGDVHAPTAASVGGLVGANSGGGDEGPTGVIAASYATGNVDGGRDGGGLVGRNAGGIILASYATGAVSGNPSGGGPEGTGGLVGYVQKGAEQENGLIAASYAAGHLYGVSYQTGGLVGYALQTDALRDNYWNSDIISVGIGNSADGERTLPGARGVSAAQLKASGGYTGIFADWRVDVDNADGDGDPATGPDEVWDFGTAEELPALKVDYDGDGTATWQEFGRQPRSGGTGLLSPFGQRPTPPPDSVPKLEVPNGKYDTDGDGLIEISNLEQLDAIRHDLDGNGVPNELTTGAPTAEFLSRFFGNRDPTVGKWANAAAHAQAFPTGPGESVCLRSCRGFELIRSLDFNDPSSYAAGQVNASWTQGRGWLSLGTGERWPGHGNAVPRFEPVFEGNGNTISNLYYDYSGLSRQEAPVAGLFGMVTIGSHIRNLGLKDVNLTSHATGEAIGSLVAENRGVISDSHATGNLETPGGVNGGLVGRNIWPGEIGNSHSAVSVALPPEAYPAGWAGGLVGHNHGLVRNSSATGNVTSDVVGGLAGSSQGTIIYSHATGQVSGGKAGGLVGDSSGAIIYSHATGPVLGNGPHAGGLVAVNGGGKVFYSYASGDVSINGISGNLAGGLIGEALKGGTSDWSLVVASYSTGKVSGYYAGSLAGTTRNYVAASYATGTVKGEREGAGLAPNNTGTIMASYSAAAVDSEARVGLTNMNEARLLANVLSPMIANYWDMDAAGFAASEQDRRVLSVNELEGVEGKSAAELRAPTGYTGIFADWNQDLDDFDWDGDPATGADDYWDFGDGSSYPALRVDFNGDGIATCQEFGEQPGCAGRPQPAAPDTTSPGTTAGGQPSTASGAGAAGTSSQPSPGTPGTGSQSSPAGPQSPPAVGSAVSPSAQSVPTGTTGTAAGSENPSPSGVSLDSPGLGNESMSRGPGEPAGPGESAGGGCSAPLPSGGDGLPIASVLLLLAPLGLVAMRKHRPLGGPA